jgi:hypothetical protein
MVGGGSVLFSVIVDALRVMWMVPRLARLRREVGTGAVIASARAFGRGGLRRAPQSRRNLQRVIRAIDRILPGEPNCLRRVLLELSLDEGAASEPVVLGVNVGLGKSTGHVWLGTAPPPNNRYDVKLSA